MMQETIWVAVEEPTHVAEVRRQALSFSRDRGFGEIRAGELAIVATELSTNILKHAGGGQILITGGTEFDGAGSVKIMALDRGPGMSNLQECLLDGYTTASSPGQGLGAIRRLAMETDFYSVSGEGTAILAGWALAPAGRTGKLRAGAVNVPKKGQDVCGDSWGIEQNDGCSVILLADGLGHGLEANVASREAVRMLHEYPDLSPTALMTLVDQALRATRGAAVAIAQVNHERGEIAFCGVGNIAAQVYSGPKLVQHLISTNGTAGHRPTRLREFAYPWPENGALVLYSDGLSTATGLKTSPELMAHDPWLISGVLFRDFTRNSDDSTVIVAKGEVA